MATAGFEGIEVLTHVAVGVAGRRAALVELLVFLETGNRVGRVDRTLHVVLAGRVLIFEAME